MTVYINLLTGGQRSEHLLVSSLASQMEPLDFGLTNAEAADMIENVR